MKYYCSSPNCRNECGHKYERINAWRDPESIQGILFYEERFCDDNGNKLDEVKKEIQITKSKQEKLIQSKIKDAKHYFI